MRIALISDIHGNTVALDAVLADLRPTEPDLIVCLGDIAAGGPDPAGAIDRLASLRCVAVQGNTDAGMVDMPPWWKDPASIGLPEDALPGMEVTVWSSEQLAPSHRDYLAELPVTATIAMGTAGEMLAFHGSPRSADEIITASTPPHDLDDMFEGHDAQWLAGGHTHVPLMRVHRGRTLVNPGSVGLPFAEYGYAGGVRVLDHAAYAVVVVADDRVGIELRQTAVDETALRASVTRSGMPQADWWLGRRARQR